ncbi:MAG: hypothetical protein JSV64_03615 [Candidatus Bathyarchaeota archaeon]|jgi:hypothetical protein|nr:MAG: hypothetical protein JSV64_03615 [Candidatus Bathyarchaeota archaeon]
MILGYEVVFASIATVLSALSFKTLRDIRHLGVGRSFWIPVFVSGILFLAGSVLTITHEMGFSLTTQTIEIVQIIRILALCVLVASIYSYSRRVKASLADDLSIPQEIYEERSKMEASVEVTTETETPIEWGVGQDNAPQKDSNREAAAECLHEFGYLRTLSRDTSIPDECLDCDKIIECKHS